MTVSLPMATISLPTLPLYAMRLWQTILQNIDVSTAAVSIITATAGGGAAAITQPSSSCMPELVFTHHCALYLHRPYCSNYSFAFQCCKSKYNAFYTTYCATTRLLLALSGRIDKQSGSSANANEAHEHSCPSTALLLHLCTHTPFLG